MANPKQCIGLNFFTVSASVSESRHFNISRIFLILRALSSKIRFNAAGPSFPLLTSP